MAYFNGGSLPMRWAHPTGASPTVQSNNNYFCNRFNSPLMSSYHQHHIQNGTSDETNCNLNNGYMPNFSQSQDYSNFSALPSLPTHHQAALSMANQSMCVQYGTYSMSPANNNRMMRNLAEKMRRDKLNNYINELSVLVPMVSNSSKRMDKTSVLRLSATFLRLNALISNTKDQHPKLPQFLKTVNWSQFLLDDMDAIMLVVTSVGKIVFISHNIEKILGHTQIELFGQSLFKITAPEDHAELKKCLSPDENEENISEACESEVTSSELVINPSCSSRPSTSRSSSRTSSSTSSNGLSMERQRRSIYLRLRHRCLARSEQPQYELVHVVGHLTIPKKLATQAHKKPRKHKVEVTATNSNEIFLVAIMKPFKERRVTELSLVEPSRDEYITRHSLDGRILYSDHRISVVAGYLSEEVAGSQAFSFMHKEDVHWVLIALRQMYWRGESYGLSCYRLKTKTGDFIYLKSHGYLEFNANTETYASFICVNSLVSEEEGKREICQMKKRYTPLIDSRNEPGIFSLAGKKAIDPGSDDELSSIEDPDELKNAISAMMLNLPKLNAEYVRDDPQKSSETPYVKAKLMSKVLPPLDMQMKEVNISPCDLSPQPPNSVSSLTSPQSSTSTSSVALSPVPSRTPQSQNRPSVLRIAPSLASRITIYNDVDNGVISSTNNHCESESPKKTDSQKFDNYNESTKPVQIKQEFIKEEVPEEENFDRVSPHDENERTGVVRCTDNVPHSPSSYERIGVVVRRSAIKRHFDFDLDLDQKSYSVVPVKKVVSSEVSRTPEELQFRPRPLNGTHSISSVQESFDHHLPYSMVNDVHGDINDSLSSSIDSFTLLPPIEQRDHRDQLVDIDSFESRSEPDEMLQLLEGANEDLKTSHFKLESRIQMQGVQINDIKDDLDRVSFTTEQFCFQTDLSQLKKQHIKQRELLMTLQQDHHSLQRCNGDGVNV